MSMKKSTKGFYTLEAAIFMPLVILAVLSLGYFMKVEGTWENCVHGAVDESGLIASKSYDITASARTGSKVKNRIISDNPHLKSVTLKNLKVMYSDAYGDYLTSYRVNAALELSLPLGFDREFELDYGIKYRGFTGDRTKRTAMGCQGLESFAEQNPVWIFPQSGTKYHAQECTYVKASAEAVILTATVKQKYDACALCNSEKAAAGEIVFCFAGENTAYHRSSCRTVERHNIVIDRSEAVKRGYSKCSKCGGG